MPKAFTQCAFPFLRLQGNVRQGKGQRTGEEEEEEGGWLVVNLQMVETVQVAVLQKFLHLPPQADYTKEPFSFRLNRIAVPLFLTSYKITYIHNIPTPCHLIYSTRALYFC